MSAIIKALITDLKTAIASGSEEAFHKARYNDRVKMIPYFSNPKLDEVQRADLEDLLEYAKLNIFGLKYEYKRYYSDHEDILRTLGTVLEICFKQHGVVEAENFLIDLVIPALREVFYKGKELLNDFNEELFLYKIPDNANYRKLLKDLSEDNKDKLELANYAQAVYQVYDTQFTKDENIPQKIAELRMYLYDEDYSIRTFAAKCLGNIFGERDRKIVDKYFGEVLDEITELEINGSGVAADFFRDINWPNTEENKYPNTKDWFFYIFSKLKGPSSLDFCAVDTILDEEDIETLKKLGRDDLAEQLKKQVDWDNRNRAK